MTFSKRSSWPLGTNPLAQLLENKKSARTKIIDLTESNPTKCGLGGGAEQLKPFSNKKNLLYEPDARGLPAARAAVCAYYKKKGIKLEPSRIFLTAGTSEAYSFLFRLLADIGDRVMVPQPSYPLFEYLADLNDLTLVNYPLEYQNGWRIDTASFESMITAEFAKAAVLIHPNNPTGNFVTGAERKAILSVCRKTGTPVICDEVFLDYNFEKNISGAESWAGRDEVLTFTLSGVSKIAGLPQMKLSWVVVSGPEKAAAEACGRLEVIADTYLSVNTPSQNALAEWLKKAPHAGIKQRVRKNYDCVKKLLRENRKLKVLQAEGGWYALIEVDADQSDEKMALRLLGKYNVLVHPGYYFNVPGERTLVISLLPEAANFLKGVNRLMEAAAERM